MHPWLAVVAKRMIPIKTSPISARRVRSPGMRILNLNSGSGSRAGAEELFPPCVNHRWQYISTCLGRYSVNPGGKSTCHNPFLATAVVPLQRLVRCLQSRHPVRRSGVGRRLRL